jgi:ABC-type branched-subunit amino acid transport system substrate-binding protein
MRSAIVRWGAVAMAAAAVAACSGSRSNDSGAATTAAATTAAATTAPATSAAATTATSGAATTAAATTTTAPKGATFGTLASPCGAGTAKTATEQGVTADKITIGFGDDAGFAASPGLNHEMSDAMKAMIKWCNDQGGINGRQIDGTYYDAKITEVNNVWLDACTKVFMMVGQGFALDGSQEDTRLGCNLATVPTYSVSADFANAPLMAQAVPNPIDYVPGQQEAALAKAFPDKIGKSALMYANFSATIDTKDKAVQAMQKYGYTILPCDQQYNINGEPDWKPFVQKLKDCGAEVVYFTGSPFPNFENVLDAAAQLDYKPIWFVDTNFYVDQFAQWNTNGNGDNVYIRMAFVPLEQAASNPAVKQYIDLVKANGGDISQLGAQATSSFLLWATAAKACGDTLTRQCVLDQIKALPQWTGGGLHAPTHPADNKPPECGLVLKLTGTAYQQWNPAQAGQFDCNPDYVVPVTGAVVDQAALGPDRVSTKHKAS